MGGTWKRALFAMVMLVVSASAGAGRSPGQEIGVRIESASQKEILALGLDVLVSNKGVGQPIDRVRGSSSTYDVPHFTRLTNTRAVRLRGAKASGSEPAGHGGAPAAHAAGRKQIASCEARTLRVEAGCERPGKTGARDEA